ncbi:DUF2812 domain-containing protein [Niallia sp.]|uniref:DUF2812 domain-containing protein n=1 Tax=Niallia sp. TaxID=2837523 RepID=UPI0028977962|nr:DUF2812 domain-containing protein [Niallia sp.]
MTKKVKRSFLKKLFINIEKEETWLNNMCKNGYALHDIANGYYSFEPCKPGEYIYRIEFLHQEVFQREKEFYLELMEDLKVKAIASVNRWHYFRRESSLGKFEIYSDIDSQIEHYKRINFIWYILALIFIIPGLTQIGTISQFALTLNIILIIIGIFFLTLAFPLTKKINDLKRKKLCINRNYPVISL